MKVEYVSRAVKALEAIAHNTNKICEQLEEVTKNELS